MYLFLVSICSSSILYAQGPEFKVNHDRGTLILKVCSVTIEGYEGKQIIFTSEKKDSDVDPRTKGLHAINGFGFIDNTGLGISVSEINSTIEVNQVITTGFKLHILVPKNIELLYSYHRVEGADSIIVKNMTSKTIISSDYNQIFLSNVSGPITVSTRYGSVNASFDNQTKGPISISSVHSSIDISIPPTIKGDLTLHSMHGKIKVSSDIMNKMNDSVSGKKIDFTHSFNSKLNGGGDEIRLSSEFGNVSLRNYNDPGI